MEDKLFVYDADKEEKSLDYFRSLNDRRVDFRTNHMLPSLSIVIPSTRRVYSRYIVRVLARILHEYSVDKPNIMEIIIINNNKPIGMHLDAIYLGKFVRVVNNSENIQTNDFLHKQCKDMMTALNYGIHTNSDYILILEDDGLPVKGFFKRLDNILKYHSSKVGLIKLYYPDKWYGYELDDIPEILIFSLLMSSLATIFMSLITNKCTIRMTVPFILVFLFLWLYLGIVIYSFGRVHWIELLRRYFPLFQRLLNAPRCCTPAVLYSRQLAITLKRDMRCEWQYPYDFALDDTVKRHQLKQFLVFPNMLTHIGFRSSSPVKSNDASEYMFLLEN